MMFSLRCQSGVRVFADKQSLSAFDHLESGL